MIFKLFHFTNYQYSKTKKADYFSLIIIEGLIKIVHTNNIEFMQPSSSGLFVTWAYFDQTTLPVWVTNPSSETFT